MNNIRAERAPCDELGVTSIEYGLIATAVAVLVAAAMLGLGPKILELFQAIG